MNEREALKLALEGLEKWHFDKDPRGAADYIAAIKEVLAQPPEEPIAWVCEGSMADEKHDILNRPGICRHLPIRTKLYTTPPQRTWVGLTEQEAADCWSTSAVQTWREIEAKLKEKNQ